MQNDTLVAVDIAKGVDPSRLPSGRHMASSLGLTPREYSRGLADDLAGPPGAAMPTCACSSSMAHARSSGTPKRIEHKDGRRSWALRREPKFVSSVTARSPPPSPTSAFALPGPSRTKIATSSPPSSRRPPRSKPSAHPRTPPGTARCDGNSCRTGTGKADRARIHHGRRRQGRPEKRQIPLVRRRRRSTSDRLPSGRS